MGLPPHKSEDHEMSGLFDPLKLGPLTLPNRILMAPLTRSRAGSARIPNLLMAQYYAQRASAGLILSEATSVTPMGVGYADTPGIWSKEQTQAWRLVTKAVHEAGGRIFLQLWHVGRISDPVFLDGALPVAPSAIQPAGTVSLMRPKRPYVTPRALDRHEIPGVIAAYRTGAENAEKAGFDGVELHGANGYLLDQFLQDKTNQRDDDYGGPIENRARLMLEATDAAISVWGADRVGLHLNLRRNSHDIDDTAPETTFTYVAREAGRRKLAFIIARESLAEPRLGLKVKQAFGGVYIANQDFTFAAAERVVADSEADAVAFGRLFIANPDLPARFAGKAALNAPNDTTFYTPGAEGYTDYPFLSAD
jgi:2,4-dienoyl-CoA reductase-like NADH-dependent reductase (Old Yellow Enzyme family)